MIIIFFYNIGINFTPPTMFRDLRPIPIVILDILIDKPMVPLRVHMFFFETLCLSLDALKILLGLMPIIILPYLRLDIFPLSVKYSRMSLCKGLERPLVFLNLYTMTFHNS